MRIRGKDSVSKDFVVVFLGETWTPNSDLYSDRFWFPDIAHGTAGHRGDATDRRTPQRGWLYGQDDTSNG